MRHAGLHGAADPHMAFLQRDARGFQIQPIHGGPPAQREEDLLGPRGVLHSVFFKNHALFPVSGSHPFQGGAGMNGHAAPGESSFHHLRHVRVHAAQQLFPALDNSDGAPDSLQVMGHFESDGPAAQHHEGFRHLIRVQRGIAGPDIRLLQARQVRPGNHGAGGDQHRACLHRRGAAFAGGSPPEW